MKRTLTFIMLSIILSWFGCTPKYAAVEFGQGGGVTNQFQTYVIKDTGELFGKADDNGEPTLIRELESKELKTVYQKLKAAGFPNLDISTTDNVYKFIEVKNKEGDPINKVVWADSQGKLTVELADLYSYLMEIAKK